MRELAAWSWIIGRSLLSWWITEGASDLVESYGRTEYDARDVQAVVRWPRRKKQHACRQCSE
jgi:hypothetical protein